MYCINLHPPDICHNQFSTASLLGNVFKPLLVKLNLKAGKYATFILQTTATFELKELKPANVIPQTSSGHRLIWWGGMRHRFAMNPMLHRTILRKSNFRIRTFTTKQV